MENEEVRRTIDILVEDITQASVGSIDHAINAKAIAVNSSSVRERIAEALVGGYRLTAITPLTGYGSSLLDFRLRFHFEKGDLIDSHDKDFVVSIELPTRSVRRIRVLAEGEIVGSPPVPFSLAVPSQAHELRTRMTDLADKINLEWDFIKSLSIKEIFDQLIVKGYNVDMEGMGGGDTPYATASQSTFPSSVDSTYGTATESGGVLDDSLSDSIMDVTMDFEMDFELDFQLDTVDQDPPSNNDDPIINPTYDPTVDPDVPSGNDDD